MRLLYTFVLDGDPRFLTQGRIFLRSALAAGIAPGDILAQVTASCGAGGYALAASYGVRSVGLPLGPDRRYCNKIMQLFNLAGCDFDVLVAGAARMARWAPHADQVAWAFAMMRLRLPFNELGIEFNFPTVIADRVPADTYDNPVVLHYHLGLDDAQLIRNTGVPSVDAAISRVNAILSA